MSDFQLKDLHDAVDDGGMTIAQQREALAELESARRESFRLRVLIQARVRLDQVPAPRFPATYCSSCGGEFGPGNHGFSHCEDHADRSAL